MLEAEEVLVPLPLSAGSVTTVRSTLLQSSILTLRERGLYERYLALLPEQHHETVLRTLAPTWLPIAAAMAHYEACQSLGLSEREQVEIGAAVGKHLQHGFLQTIARTSQNLGVTPWVVLKQMHRIWDRTFQGGGCAVVKLGPKDARADMHGLLIARIPYFRNAWRGAFNVAMSVFSARAFCKIVAPHGGPNSVSYRVAWV